MRSERYDADATMYEQHSTHVNLCAMRAAAPCELDYHGELDEPYYFDQIPTFQTNPNLSFEFFFFANRAVAKLESF